MSKPFTYRKRVEFAETDAAGILHFSNYYKYMEMTEHAFLRSLGFPSHGSLESGRLGWPRVHVECEYKAPLRFEDEVDIELTVGEIRGKSIDYQFTFLAADTGKPVASGKVTVVCVGFSEGGELQGAIPIPARIVERMTAAMV